MRTGRLALILTAGLTLAACGNGGDDADPVSAEEKAAYAEQHISCLNTIDTKEVESGVGPLFEFVTRFQVRNTGDRDFKGRFNGYFSLPGNRGRIPFQKDFTVGPGGETIVEIMFRHTEDGVSATCTEMTPL